MKAASLRYESKGESLTLSTQLTLSSRAASGHAKPTSLLAQLIFLKCIRAVFFAFEPPRSTTRESSFEFLVSASYWQPTVCTSRHARPYTPWFLRLNNTHQTPAHHSKACTRFIASLELPVYGQRRVWML